MSDKVTYHTQRLTKWSIDMSQSAMIGFIESHGHAAWIYSAAKLHVTSYAVNRDGTTEEIQELIDSTWPAVRGWLGY